jgi:hypothetical protein
VCNGQNQHRSVTSKSCVDMSWKKGRGEMSGEPSEVVERMNVSYKKNRTELDHRVQMSLCLRLQSQRIIVNEV